MPDENERPANLPLDPLFKAVLDNINEGIMLIDREDRIRMWNDAYLDMLDLPPHLFEIGANVMPLIRVLADRGDYGPGDPAELSNRIAENVRARKTASGERPMTNGRIIAAEWIDLADGYFLFRVTNVTTERMASRFKDELISTVSHELRTPLTSIRGGLGLLQASGIDQQRAAELVRIALTNSERLIRLVDDLLDIDKLQFGSLDFYFEPTDIGQLLSSAVSQNLPYAERLHVGIDLELPKKTISAEVDQFRLIQVMSNLLSNGAKFSPAGSRLRVRLIAGDTSFRISVIDHGRGMSPEFRRRLFTRFAQENRSSEHGQKGTGLGLAICKSIVDNHRGRVHVDSQEGGGTIFHVDLPYHQAAARSA